MFILSIRLSSFNANQVTWHCKYDTDSLNAANEETAAGVEFSYFEARLDKNTAALAEGHHAICIFVNDVCDAEVLEQLHKHGVV